MEQLMLIYYYFLKGNKLMEYNIYNSSNGTLMEYNIYNILVTEH